MVSEGQVASARAAQLGLPFVDLTDYPIDQSAVSLVPVALLAGLGVGTGFAHGIWIRDVGVVQNAWGRPEVIYSPRGEKVRKKLGIGNGYITLTDEAGLIVAVAVLETAVRRPRKKKKR